MSQYNNSFTSYLILIITIIIDKNLISVGSSLMIINRLTAYPVANHTF